MSERSIRVNELILRELSHILRTRFREQTVSITLTEVDVSPDLRSGRVYYSVIGDERAKIKARSFFTKEYRTLRQLVAQKVILKYFPKINFMEDDSIARGNRVLDLIGEIDGLDADARNGLRTVEPDAEAAEEGEDYEETGYAEGADASEYAFDEDDLEYARDLRTDDDEDDEDEDEFEEFDEESDVEYDGELDEDLDDEEGFGKHSGR